MTEVPVHALLHRALSRPPLWSAYTADTLWTDPYVSAQMLRYHLDPECEPASRPHAFIGASVDWIAQRFDVGPGTVVLDAGCGPGLYANALAARGARVTGVDFSAGSLAHARAEAEARGLQVDYVEASYLTWAPPPELRGGVDLATLIYCDLCALSPEQRRDLLTTLRRCLAADGRLLFDVCSRAAFDAVVEDSTIAAVDGGGFWAAGEHVEIRRTFRYDDEAVRLDRYTIVEPTRVWEVCNWLQHFDPEDIAAELSAVGLRVVDVVGDVAGAAYDASAPVFAVIAEPDDA